MQLTLKFLLSNASIDVTTFFEMREELTHGLLFGFHACNELWIAFRRINSPKNKNLRFGRVQR
jgi:hypothetical protein